MLETTIQVLEIIVLVVALAFVAGLIIGGIEIAMEERKRRRK